MELLTGFILSYLKYGDFDAILHIFTKENGYQSFYLKGIYSPKNKKRAYLFPLNEINFSVLKNRNQNLQTISKIDSAKNLSFSNDVKHSSVVFFIADFLNQILKNENPSEHIYSEINYFLEEIWQEQHQNHLIFLIVILKIQGLAPLFSVEEFLNPETGEFSNTQTHPLFNKELSLIWKIVISNDKPYLIKINPQHRKVLLDGILVYYQYHFGNFRTPKSLEIVQQIFR